MVFKRLLGSLGVGAPKVDTVLDPGPVLPGGPLSGQVHMEGGSADYEIEEVALELVARVEAESEEAEAEGAVAFARWTVGGGFRLPAGERHALPFTVTLPWETPVTELYGQPFGIVVGVRTELVVAGAKDAGDIDPLSVAALPAQAAILDALGHLGFGFASADLELGQLHGTGQQLPFYQEIELVPPPHYAGAVNELELTFLAGPGGVEVVLEADKRGGLFDGGHDALNHHAVSHDSVDRTDWAAEVDAWVRGLVERHGAAHGYHGGYQGQPGYPAPYKDDHHGDHHGDDHHGSGPGMGTVIAAGAAGLAVGVVGGLVAAEVVDEVGDFFEGDEDEGDDEG
ncbi:sporulation protein [Streptomyces sp. PT12]|uniref:sporulation protein n=1 Tax=Streptomyces sp. PT12 TaxID=1510197 RepID=UPI000DE4D75A|nr:sporulation protein [Streptomyces sp. PT12]RBM18419.1 sporulation protein [Streptomyces sp. PT12]